MADQLPESGPWKPSTFNLVLSDSVKHLLFNSVSSQIIDLSQAQFELVQRSLDEIESTGECGNARLLQALVSLGMVVPIEVDEYGREKSRFQSKQRSRDRLHLTVAPTMACNLRCTYCFQAEIPRGRAMSDDVQVGLVEFVRHKAKESKALTVQWFGGEPTVAYRHILSLSTAFQQICRDFGISYYAEMLTNGTLLTEEIIETFSRIGLKAIQIPLDGMPETYAERKGVSVKRAETFYRFVIEHAGAIADACGSLTVRINVDRDNAEEAREVVELFRSRGMVDARIDFRLGFLNVSRGIIECIPHDCLSTAEFTRLEQDFREFLFEAGYVVYGMPEPRDYPCIAPLDQAYTIDPDGRIGKCVPATGTEQSVFARIYPGDLQRTLSEIDESLAPYSTFNPFDSPMCRTCKLLPVCLGSCPKMHVPGAQFNCLMKDGLLERLSLLSAIQGTGGPRSD